MEMTMKRRNRKLVLFFLAIFMSCTNKNPKQNSSFADMKPEPLVVKFDPNMLDSIDVILYDTSYDFERKVSVINNAKFSFGRNNGSPKEYYVLIPEMNYNYNIEIVLFSGGKKESHRFSNIVVSEFEGSEFNHYAVTSYTYNGKFINSDCNFKLDSKLNDSR